MSPTGRPSIAACGSSTNAPGALPEPVVAPGLTARAVHPLLHDDPRPVVRDDEAVQVELEAVLHRRAVDLRHQAARAHERRARPARRDRRARQLVGRAPRMPPAAAADVKPELALDRPEAALERADHAGGDPRRVPVHPHHRAERLEPERVRQPAQHLGAPVLVRDRLDDHAAEARHARREPGGHAPAVQGQVGGSGRARAHPASLAPPSSGRQLAETSRTNGRFNRRRPWRAQEDHAPLNRDRLTGGGAARFHANPHRHDDRPRRSP